MRFLVVKRELLISKERKLLSVERNGARNSISRCIYNMKKIRKNLSIKAICTYSVQRGRWKVAAMMLQFFIGKSSCYQNSR